MIYQLIGLEKSEYNGKAKYNAYFVNSIGKEKGSGFKPLMLVKYGQNGRYSTFPYFRTLPDFKVNGKYEITFNQYGDIEKVNPVD